jgi:hypothetical protein
MGKVPALSDGDVVLAEKFNGIEPSPARSRWRSFDLMLQTLEQGLAGKTRLSESAVARACLVGVPGLECGDDLGERDLAAA